MWVNTHGTHYQSESTDWFVLVGPKIWNGIRWQSINQKNLQFPQMHLLGFSNQLIGEWHSAFDETFVLICRQLGGAAHLVFIGNRHINQLKDGLCFVALFECQLNNYHCYECRGSIQLLRCSHRNLEWTSWVLACDWYSNQLECSWRIVIKG